MTTKLIMPFQDSDTGASKIVYVVEDFDAVMNKLNPLSPPSSSLEHRELFQYHLVDGRRIWAPPGNVAYAEENCEE